MSRHSSNISGAFKLTVLAIAALALPALCLADDRPFLDRFDTVNLINSTVPAPPAKQDINPYGVAVVRHSVGLLKRGDILVSNFNDADNQQGTGVTIVQLSPDGAVSLFAQIDPATVEGVCPGVSPVGVGLTTALVVLRRGWVIVGSLPTTDGMPDSMGAGCLIVLNSQGQVVETLHGNGINGPWDMTALDDKDRAWLFVTNVLNGPVTTTFNPAHVDMGTVLRIPLQVPKQGEGIPTPGPITMIGSEFPEASDPVALVIGPTGLGLGKDGTLYVADSFNNRIAAIPDALKRTTTAHTGVTVSANGAISDPLGLAIAPNGHIITANGGDGNLVETTPAGAQVAVKTVEAAGAGSLFGIATVRGGKGVYLVDDADNTLRVLESKDPGENDDEDDDD